MAITITSDFQLWEIRAMNTAHVVWLGAFLNSPYAQRRTSAKQKSSERQNKITLLISIYVYVWVVSSTDLYTLSYTSLKLKYKTYCIHTVIILIILKFKIKLLNEPNIINIQ